MNKKGEVLFVVLLVGAIWGIAGTLLFQATKDKIEKCPVAVATVTPVEVTS